jgi:hypothetical protein
LRSTAVGCAARQTNATVDGVLSANPALSLSGATLTINAGSPGTLTYRWQPDDVAATKPALLESRDWQLTSIAGRAVQGQIRLYASAAAASVTFGCGAVGGNVEIGPGTLRIDGVPDAPAAGCDGDRANDSSTVDSFLSQQPALWRIEDGKLLIFGGGAQAFSLVFAPDKPIAQASAPPAVDGKSWRLSQLSTEGSGSGSGSGSSSTGVVLTVTGATFTLDTNCHNYAGTASRTADKIEFSDVRDGGGRDCHDEFADAAVRLVQHGSATWSIKAGELVLVQGNTTLTFDR